MAGDRSGSSVARPYDKLSSDAFFEEAIISCPSLTRQRCFAVVPGNVAKVSSNHHHLDSRARPIAVKSYAEQIL